jgi:iron complex outermembrane receptor protein
MPSKDHHPVSARWRATQSLARWRATQSFARWRATLLVAASAAALALGAPAWGQTAAPQLGAQNVQQGGITDIIVTATRRSQSVQKASVPIAVIGARELARAGVTRAMDLSGILPGVEVGSAGGPAQIYIRGVGTTATNGLAEEAVAFNVDGIYVSRPTAVNNAFFDVSRVEVLEGPQGTLYGKNATGGAINVITNDPSTSKFSGTESLEVGDYGLVVNEASVNVPVTDQFALRGAFSFARHDGYLSDGTDDENNAAVRVKALITPNDDLRIVLSGDFAGTYGRGDGAVVHPAINPSNPWEAESSAASNALLEYSPLGGSYPGSPFAFFGPYGLLAPITNNISQNNRQWGLSSDITWNLGFGTLTSLTGYRQDPASYTTYIPGFFVRDTETDAQVSQEFRLSGQYDRFKWVVGAYYFNESQDFDLYDNAGIVSSGRLSVPVLTDDSYAGFGEATYSVLPTLRIILGDRYTRELKTIDGAYITRTIFPFAHSSNEHADNYKVGFEYDVRPQSMLYFTASTGFKSGGFYPNVGPDFFKPEKLTAYELGIKNRFFDNHLELNLEAFDWDYTNRQFSHLGEVTNQAGQALGAVILGTYNAGQATLRGFDATAKIAVTDNDTFSVEAEYNSTLYNNFIYTQPFGFASSASNGCILGPNVKGTQTIDCAGRPLSRAPMWSGTLGFEHDADLGFGTLQANIRTHLSSSYWLDVDYVPNERASGYTRTDFDLTYRPASGRWSLAAYVHNLENSAVYTGGVEQPFVSGLTVATILPPRTFGGRFTVGF